MKDIPGYEGLYAATEEGLVFRHSRSFSIGIVVRTISCKPIKTWRNMRGYLYTSLRKNGTRKTIGTHRLIASTFIPNPNNLPQVNHKNGIKTDNRVENLEWCDGFRNSNHAFEIGLNKNFGIGNHKAKLTEKQVLEIREKRNSGQTIVSIGKQYGICHTTVSAICLRKLWKRL